MRLNTKDDIRAPAGDVGSPGPDAPGELFRAVYASTATRDLRDEELVAILDVSRRDNVARWDVTGALAYHDRSFIQVLEGSEASVQALLATIARDARHTGMTVLDRSAIDGRVFGAWSMGWVQVAAATRAGFDPGVLFLRDTSSALVNAMIEAFRLSVRLDLRIHRDPG